MAPIINPAILANTFGGFAAKQMAAGVIKGFAKEWRIEAFKEAADKDYGITHMFAVSPAWSDTLKGALQKYKGLQKVTANELLKWIQDANPILFTQICAEPTVITWFYSKWEEGKAELLGVNS